MEGLETAVLLGVTVLAGAILAPRIRVAAPLGAAGIDLDLYEVSADCPPTSAVNIGFPYCMLR